MQSYFIWNNVDCRSMGVLLSASASIVRPQERVQHITISGRDGELTQTESDNGCVFQSYIQTVNISVKGARTVSDVLEWLKGSGYVTFSAEPERRQKARVIGAVTLNKQSRNLDWWNGEVQFYCEPLKETLFDNAVSVSVGGTVVNDGCKPSRPVLTVGCSAGSVVKVGFGSATFTVDLTGQSITSFVIDCDAEEVTTANGSTLITSMTSGTFPVLNVGRNTVAGSGFTSLSVERRCKYL